MSKDTILNIAQIVIAVSLVTLLLLQVKGVGSGFFGEAYSTFRTRRGFEQTLFRVTIVLVLVFLGVALARAKLG